MVVIHWRCALSYRLVNAPLTTPFAPLLATDTLTDFT